MEKFYSVNGKRLLLAIAVVVSWFTAIYLLSSGSTLLSILGFYLVLAVPAVSVGALLGHPVIGLACGTASAVAFMALTLLFRY